jgi:hypothetical protein
MGMKRNLSDPLFFSSFFLDNLEESGYPINYKLQRVLVWKKKSRIALHAYAAFLLP